MNILFLTSFSISDLKTGRATRIYQLIKNLLYIKNVSIYLLTPEKLPDLNCISYFSHRDIIKRLNYISIIDDFNPFRIQKILEIIKKYDIDLIQNEYFYGFLNLIPLKCYKIPIIIDDYDVPYLFAKEISRNILIQKYILWLDKLAVTHSSHVLTVSQIDKANINKFYNINPNKISVIPNGTDVRKFKNINANEKLILKQKFGLENKFILIFHGAPFHKPNRDAFKTIILLAPKLKQKIQNLQIILIGNPYIDYNFDYIQSFPPLEDLASFLPIADVAIVPITKGSGTRLKIFEYLASGIPIVSTKKGAEGIQVENDKHILLSDNIDQDFINNIVLLYKNEEKRKNLAIKGRKLVEEIYDWRKISQELYKLYQRFVR